MTCPTCKSELYSNGVCPNCDTIVVTNEESSHLLVTGFSFMTLQTLQQIISVSYAMAGASE